MFERLTADARAVVVGAQEVCRERGDREIGPVHLILAMTVLESPLGVLLAGRGLDADSVGDALGAHGAGGAAASTPRRALDADDAEALRVLGIDLDAIREAVEASFGEGALDGPATVAETPDEDGTPRRGRFGLGGAGRPRFTAGARKSLELGLREAIRAHSDSIRSEHIALGVLRADDVAVVLLLRQLGVDKAALRADIESRLRRSA